MTNNVSSVLLDAVAKSAFAEAQARGIRLVVKTSITPRVTVYDSRDTGQSLLSALGVRTRATIEDANGRVVAEYGDAEVPNDFVLGAVIYGVAALTAFAAIATLARVMR